MVNNYWLDFIHHCACCGKNNLVPDFSKVGMKEDVDYEEFRILMQCEKGHKKVVHLQPHLWEDLKEKYNDRRYE